VCMATNMINCMNVMENGQQTAVSRGQPQVKFVDTNNTVSIFSTGSILAPGLTNIGQGVGVSQRTGDTVFYKKLFLNYTIDAQNSDIFSNGRVIVFQWKPNTTLLAPTVADILQTTSMYSMYDWQNSNQYIIIYDKIHSLAGLATAPSASGNQNFFGSISLSKALKRVEFTTAAAGGSNQLFLLIIGDSVLAPFPTFTYQTRITYSQE